MLGKEIGVGRTATVYEYGEDQVIKLFNEGFNQNFIKSELELTQKVNELTDYAPTAFRIIEIEEKSGIVFEFVKGKELVSKITRRPSQVTFYAKEFADPQVEFNRIETEDFINQIDYFRKRIEKSGLEEDVVKRILSILESLENDNKLCHGDYHPYNFIYGKTKKILDWSNAYQGHPVGDVLRSNLLITSPSVTQGMRGLKKKYFQLLVKLFVRVYMNYYLTRNPIKVKSLDSWEIVIYAARLCENVPNEKEWLLSNIHKRLNRLDV